MHCGQESAFAAVRLEALEAYADAHPVNQPNAYTRRKLDWRASASVSRDQAIAIMRETCPSYNLFEPSLLRKLPADARVTLAREGSVCVYTDKIGSASIRAKDLKADEFSHQNGETRIWWD